jgi:hypothetical protein
LLQALDMVGGGGVLGSGCVCKIYWWVCYKGGLGVFVYKKKGVREMEWGKLRMKNEIYYE